MGSDRPRCSCRTVEKAFDYYFHCALGFGELSRLVSFSFPASAIKSRTSVELNLAERPVLIRLRRNVAESTTTPGVRRSDPRF